LARLIRDGVLRPRLSIAPAAVFNTPPPRADGSAVASLIGDRRWSTFQRWPVSSEIEPSEIVRENALRFLRVHPLRAADALQLAAAFLAAERRPSSLELVTLDDRLAEAAPKEGFELIEVVET
jgi:hypothetical protein